jgi:ATP-binding cassette subfamily B protein
VARWAAQWIWSGHWRPRRIHAVCGVIPQSDLFSGTIRENIRYGRLEATDADIEIVAGQVGAAEFISQLKGYDTEVGESGNRLSTGQKQFVSLARAMLSDPQILILDDVCAYLPANGSEARRAR